VTPGIAGVVVPIVAGAPAAPAIGFIVETGPIIGVVDGVVGVLGFVGTVIDG
jgi:hypothetical protein